MHRFRRWPRFLTCSHIECSIRREAQRQGRPFCMHVEPGDPRRCLPVAVVPRASAGATALGLEGSQEGVPGEDTLYWVWSPRRLLVTARLCFHLSSHTRRAPECQQRQRQLPVAVRETGTRRDVRALGDVAPSDRGA